MAQLPDAVPDLTQMVRSRGLLGSVALITTEKLRSECQLLSLMRLKIMLITPPYRCPLMIAMPEYPLPPEPWPPWPVFAARVPTTGGVPPPPEPP